MSMKRLRIGCSLPGIRSKVLAVFWEKRVIILTLHPPDPCYAGLSELILYKIGVRSSLDSAVKISAGAGDAHRYVF